MRYFAEIPVNGAAGFGPAGVVKAVFPWELEADPEYAPDTVIAVDVTAANPRPEPGWAYDGAAFAPPEPELEA